MRHFAQGGWFGAIPWRLSVPHQLVNAQRLDKQSQFFVRVVNVYTIHTCFVNFFTKIMIE
jgi:hypothetical protein